ncbi:helix-turn-helix domain-containing protein [Serratia fonticola]|uniref:Helix-turn-helix domain-containing protein n=1 Tax=Serratia fonticola TaxID=47917 RepID=A0ABY9PI90_SERFO|nr:helix-turn-helix domain-containing protein [Serratia fonticola]WMT12542.1 helix-turn-helix domain-containing protein [Serratia fonticola]
MSQLSERVKNRRKALGLTQVELASLTGLSQQSIQSIESGDVKRTRYILELAEALVCEAAWLLHGTEPEKSSDEQKA